MHAEAYATMEPCGSRRLVVQSTMHSAAGALWNSALHCCGTAYAPGHWGRSVRRALECHWHQRHCTSGPRRWPCRQGKQVLEGSGTLGGPACGRGQHVSLGLLATAFSMIRPAPGALHCGISASMFGQPYLVGWQNEVLRGCGSSVVHILRCNEEVAVNAQFTDVLIAPAEAGARAVQQLPRSHGAVSRSHGWSTACRHT